MWVLFYACLPSPEQPSPGSPAYGEVLSDTLIGDVNDVVADTRRIFLCGEDGVRVYDSGDPYNPTLYQSYYVSDPCYTADILNNRVLLGSRDAFRSYAPNNMLVRGEYFPSFAVQALDVSAGGTLAWLAGTDEDGQVWLEEVVYREDAAMQSRSLQAIDAATPVALSALPDGLMLLDADGVLHLFSAALERVSQWSSDAPGSDLFMATGDSAHAYISLGSGGLAIIDVGDLFAPSLASTWPDDGGATYDVLLVGSALYIGRPDAVRVLDVSSPEVPAPIGAEDIGLIGTPTRMWVDNRYAYLVDAENGTLSIVNLED